MFSGVCKKTGMVLAVSMPVVLGGCALPLPVQIASWAIDGISYIATDKSVADHGLSAALDRDCALLRTVTEGKTCRDDSNFEIALREEFRDINKDPDAQAAEAAETAETISWADTELADFDVASGPAEAAPEEMAEAPGAADAAQVEAPVPAGKAEEKVAEAPAAEPEPAFVPVAIKEGVDLFYVIGSFSEPGRAHRHAKRYADLKPSVMPVKIRSEKEVFRVLVGPYRKDEMREAGQRLHAFGVRHAWGVRIDPGDWQAARLDPRHPRPAPDDSPSVASLR